MITKIATISKNKQIAIPASFGFKHGQKVKITLNEQTQEVTIKKLPDFVDELYGIAKNLNFSSQDFLKEKKDANLKRSKKLK